MMTIPTCSIPSEHMNSAAPAMDPLAELDAQIRSCTRCSGILASHPVNPPHRPELVVPRPILSKPFSAPIMLVGQAPGLSEYDTGLPFQGPAGQGIRQLFTSCGIQPDEFDAVVYQTSAAKCFPGRKSNAGRWEDRPPDSTMIKNCSPFLSRQIELVDPAVIVCLGITATRAVRNLMGRPSSSLTDVLGMAEDWDQRKVLFLTHTSGTNRLLNSESNKRRQGDGLRRLGQEIRVLRDLGRI
jgi:uracil-DNA glycosylase family 4